MTDASNFWSRDARPYHEVMDDDFKGWMHENPLAIDGDTNQLAKAWAEGFHACSCGEQRTKSRQAMGYAAGAPSGEAFDAGFMACHTHLTINGGFGPQRARRPKEGA